MSASYGFGARFGVAARLCVVASLLAAALVVRPVATGSAAAACNVVIYKIYYDSPGTDSYSNSSLNGEWIQLYNPCSTGKSLSGWKIKDAAGATYSKFGTITLGALAKVKVHTGSGSNTSTDRYWGSSNYIWNNTGSETGKLYNGSGTVVDSCSYSDVSGTAKESASCYP